MSYMRHHAIIVTSFMRKKEGRQSITLEDARDRAVAAFTIDGQCLVSEIVDGAANGYGSFMIAPDGSKEGWPTSDDAEHARDAFIEWLDAQRFEDGSSLFCWVEVQFGDDKGETKVLRDSDAYRRARLKK